MQANHIAAVKKFNLLENLSFVDTPRMKYKHDNEIYSATITESIY